MLTDPAQLSAPAPADGHGPDLAALLSQVLPPFTLEFERESRLSLPFSANALRVLTEKGVGLGDLPRLAGVSKEAISASVGLLDRRGHIVIEPDPTASPTKMIRLTAKGRKAQDASRRLGAGIEERWRKRFGDGDIDKLRDSLQGILERRDGEHPLLSQGPQPCPEGWRASKTYARQTAAVLRDPGAALPHRPMVLHRGGFPDGS